MQSPRSKSEILLFDNGAGSIKYGLLSSSGKPLEPLPFSQHSSEGSVFSSSSSEGAVDGSSCEPLAVPNCCGRLNKQVQLLVADQAEAVQNGSSLNFLRAFDRGYCVNWNTQLDVWLRVLTKIQKKPKDLSLLVVTEPLINPEPLQNEYNEVIFEELEFPSVLRCPAPWFSAYEFQYAPPEGTVDPTNCLVIDAGFSFSHSVPVVNGKIVAAGVRRVDIGGKVKKAMLVFLKMISVCDRMSFRPRNISIQPIPTSHVHDPT